MFMLYSSQSRFARQLSRTRESQNETYRLLPPTRAGEVPPQAAERAKSWPQRSVSGKVQGSSADRDAHPLALSQFLRRIDDDACKNWSAAPAAPSLLRPLDALGAAARAPARTGPKR